MSAHSFPRQLARTRRFTLGSPAKFKLAPGGERLTFLRTRGGRDTTSCLWQLTLTDNRETLIADPTALLAGETETVPREELLRRECAREFHDGITVYSTDAAANRACFALSGRLWLAELTDPVPAGDGSAREVAAAGPVVDPQLDPGGQRVAYMRDGTLRVADIIDGTDRVLAEPDAPEVTFGLPEYVAVEEIGRDRGFWWAPDGSRLAVARVDVSKVQRYWISAPACPTERPVQVPYPRAGTANADVSLWVVGLDGNRVAVEWDRHALEYLAAVTWGPAGLVIVAQSRDQRVARVLRVDPVTGRTAALHEDTDPAWVRLAKGVPAFTVSGELVWVSDVGGTRRLLIGGEPVTATGLQVRSVVGVDGDTVLFTASGEQMQTHLWTYAPDTGSRPVTSGSGLYDGYRLHGTTVLMRRALDQGGVAVTVTRRGHPARDVASTAEAPSLKLRIELLNAGTRQIRSALLLPSWYQPGSRPLPVLVDSYAGPASQRVVDAQTWWYLVSQWFAEQGFAVIIADGRGTPGRDPAWERSIRGDLAEPVLADQLDAIHAIADRHPGTLDLGRIAIRGWSFGGFLAALAVLRRPDIFRAGIAGAGLFDHRLYDTYFKERYLGHPDLEPGNYDRCCLLQDAERLARPLLLIHGLADANVVPASTLRMSAALFAAGKPHNVLLLPGVTHSPARHEQVEVNLLLLQRDFLMRSLSST